MRPTVLLVLVIGVLSAPTAGAQDLRPFTDSLERTYRVLPNITYLTATGYDAKLDLYLPSGVKTPVPTLMYFHGGGWTGGNKEAEQLRLLPFLEMGFAVANVEYRLARVAQAPAAVEDCLCALRWMIRNAKQYNVDTNRIVVMGHSAGGHLALTTGMMPASEGLDRQCPGTEPLKVAAIVNWFGISDVVDLLDGTNMKDYAVTWLGSRPNRVEVAKRVSPLTYVRAGLPPIISLHGDRDPTVPYSHSTRLHQALKQAGVPEQLVTIPGAGHGRFTPQENIRAFAELRAFLAKHGVVKATQGSN